MKTPPCGLPPLGSIQSESWGSDWTDQAGTPEPGFEFPLSRSLTICARWKRFWPRTEPPVRFVADSAYWPKIPVISLLNRGRHSAKPSSAMACGDIGSRNREISRKFPVNFPVTGNSGDEFPLDSTHRFSLGPAARRQALHLWGNTVPGTSVGTRLQCINRLGEGVMEQRVSGGASGNRSASVERHGPAPSRFGPCRPALPDRFPWLSGPQVTGGDRPLS